MSNRNIVKLFKTTINNNDFLGFKNNKQWKWISRQHLNNMVNNGIQILNDHSVKPGDRIAFKGKNSKEWVAWNLATLSVGGIWVPMYPQQDLLYSQHVIDDCQPKLRSIRADVHFQTMLNRAKKPQKVTIFQRLLDASHGFLLERQEVKVEKKSNNTTRVIK